MIAVSALAVSAAAIGVAGQAERAARSRNVLTQALPALDGQHLRVALVEVRYGPGESTAAHTHPCPVIGYVIDGAVRMRVDDGPEVVYGAGDSFYEPPNAKHLVSANASTTEATRFLAYLTCDREGPLTTLLQPENR